MQRLLIILGVLLLLVGLLWTWLGKLPFGRLPGDISVQRDNFHLYIPITSMLIVSAVISLLLWFWRR
jgi:hypothetical protein